MSLKFAISTQTLKKAVSIATRAADKRGVMPIIGYIAIEAREGKLRLTATDLELTLSVAVEDAKIEAGGAMACNAPSKGRIRPKATTTSNACWGRSCAAAK